MPQFDFYSFATQTFWILAFLGLFYFFVLFFYLSHYAEVLKFRKVVFLFICIVSSLVGVGLPFSLCDVGGM
jgi:hypothetical protein